MKKLFPSNLAVFKTKAPQYLKEQKIYKVLCVLWNTKTIIIETWQVNIQFNICYDSDQYWIY